MARSDPASERARDGRAVGGNRPDKPINLTDVVLQAYIRVHTVSPRKRTSVFLDPELLAGLKALKARDGIPEAEAIRRAIAEHLARRGVTVKTDRKRAATRKRS